MSPQLTAAVAAAPSALRTVWNSPLYRGATAALFLSGLGTSAAAPQITLFLVDDLHVSLTTAGLYYLTNITAPVAGYLIGARSDRSGSRPARRPGLGVMLPQAIATASAIFMTSTAIASALGGLTGSVGVSLLGLPHVFLAPACYGLTATAGIAVMSRSRHGVR